MSLRSLTNGYHMYNEKDEDEEIAAIKLRRLIEFQRNMKEKASMQNISVPVSLTDVNFKEEVLKYAYLLVDFWAPWCGPCRMVSPVIEQLAKDYAGRIVFAKVNVDENQSIAKSFAIQSIPTMIIFKNGKVFDVITGALPKAQIEIKLKQLLASDNLSYTR
ncbi:MAG TPA: thioredoxin [Nitrososphaeraceae archaeon]|nr:thioredoxin [Nitrososphaeraceae archaeon]